MLNQNQDLKTLHQLTRHQRLSQRVETFNRVIPTKESTYLRTIVSAADREVVVKDRHTGELKHMLMFASNNYLGLANHPHVKATVKKAIDDYGCGIGCILLS